MRLQLRLPLSERSSVAFELLILCVSDMNRIFRSVVKPLISIQILNIHSFSNNTRIVFQENNIFVIFELDDVCNSGVVLLSPNSAIRQ